MPQKSLIQSEWIVFGPDMHGCRLQKAMFRVPCFIQDAIRLCFIPSCLPAILRLANHPAPSYLQIPSPLSTYRYPIHRDHLSERYALENGTERVLTLQIVNTTYASCVQRRVKRGGRACSVEESRKKPVQTHSPSRFYQISACIEVLTSNS